MNKLTIAIAVLMLPGSIAATALADQPDNPGQGYEHSGNDNSVLNAGPGNGGEAIVGGVPTSVPNERGGFRTRDADPGQSGGRNQAPATPPGQQ